VRCEKGRMEERKNGRMEEGEEGMPQGKIVA
jgi:hypothetical protein